MIIQDSTRNSLDSKHGYSDSTNALSPLGQEAIDILDELCNTLDDQSKMDQKPSVLQSMKSLEMINDDEWIDVSENSSKPNLLNIITSGNSPSIHNNFENKILTRKTSSGSAPQTTVTTSPTNNLTLSSGYETLSVQDVLKRYNRSHENISTNFDNQTLKNLSKLQNSTRSVSFHQFESTHLNKKNSFSKKDDQHNVRLRINANDEPVIFIFDIFKKFMTILFF